MADHTTGVAATESSDAGPGLCPVIHDGGLPHPTQGDPTRSWWPHKLNLDLLAKDPPAKDPMGPGFDYAAEFGSLDLPSVKADIERVLTTSQPWWPADFGHYGPLIIRMSWHAAGTYRVMDGRGGAGHAQQRFAPLNSWPDNVSLDKARRLLWPVKKKYGRKLSWADLMVLAGNVALESMGLRTFGFGGGRVDAWEPEDDVYWGAETEWLGTDQRYSGERDLEQPLAATTMGLIYVNPEGPEGVPDPLAAARDIRETFARMAMNDEETVALIAGGHTFGKTHGAHPDDRLGPAPEDTPLEDMGLGWKNGYGKGHSEDTLTGGPEVTWSNTPVQWSNAFFTSLFTHEWELTTSPAGAQQFVAVDADDVIPDAHVPGRFHKPTMLVTDLSLRDDPIYGPISRRFYEHPDELADAFARAWFKLTHRDLGPVTRYLGPEVPTEDLLWQDPVPDSETDLSAADLAALKTAIADSGLSVAQLVKPAWAAAACFRSSDKRGGANGGRLRLDPQRGWEVNEPDRLDLVIRTLEGIRAVSPAPVSFADLVVLAGGVGIEQAARAAGVDLEVPFSPGRGDAGAEQTDEESFSYLEPTHDGFRNYVAKGHTLRAENLLLDRANLLGLTAPETTVLIGGLRVLGANHRDSDLGVLTETPGRLTNDFFVNLLDLDTVWRPVGDSASAEAYEGLSDTGQKRWTASRVDLVFGADSELRALAEVYACDDAQPKFVADFVAAWVKVMNADRFDLN